MAKEYSSLVVYDSTFGNTEKIAQVIAHILHAKLLHIKDTTLKDLENISLLVFGSPVQGGRPTVSIDNFIKKIPPSFLNGVNIATFDTRFKISDQNLGLRLLMNVIQYAAEKMENALKIKGGISISEPQGFIVEKKEGPLKDGELEIAKQYALSLIGNKSELK